MFHVKHFGTIGHAGNEPRLVGLPARHHTQKACRLFSKNFLAQILGDPHRGEETSNRPVSGEIVDVIDEAARGEQRDDLRRRLPGTLFV